MHQVLSARNFRAVFSKVHVLAAQPVQKWFTTGTLPHRLVESFLTSLALPLDTKIIRAPSDQPHISYNIIVVDTTSTTPERLAIDIAKAFNSIIGPDRIGIIFCASRQSAETVNNDFTDCLSHGNMSPTDRTANENLWKTKQRRWIAATTGLIQGIDHPDVGAVIFIHLPFGLLNVYQGGGRSGRDGRKSWSVLIHRRHSKEKVPSPIANDTSCIGEANEWVDAHCCRRLGFSRMLDNRDMPCKNIPGSHLCDVCDPNSRILLAIRPLIPDPPTNRMNVDRASSSIAGPITNAPGMGVHRALSYYHMQAKTLVARGRIIPKLTNRLRGKCAVCWAWKGVLVDRHNGTFVTCSPTRGFVSHATRWRDFKKQIHLDKYVSCWSCGLPQDHLPDGHRQMGSQQGQNQCPYDDLVVHLIWFIRHDINASWPAACDDFHDSGLTLNISETEFAKWVTRSESPQHFYNGLELVLWFWCRQERVEMGKKAGQKRRAM